MSIQSNFPAIKPTLLLDFANTEQLDPRITFTRASTATYFDQFGVMQTAASGVARFDHNPTTFESLGLLIEEQRTNLFVRSEEFDNASWTGTAISVSINSAISPNGTLTADTLIPTAVSSGHFTVQAFTATSGVAYTTSVYAKASGYSWLRLSFGTTAFASNGRAAVFNISTGVIGTVQSGVAATMQSVGNGWYRCSITATANASASTNTGFTVNNADSADAITFTGDGSSGIYLWGAQLEAGAFPTSYIQTVASQVTRAADAASMTGTNFSSWYNAAEGTVYVESLTNNPSAVSSTVVSLFASASNYQRIRHVGALIDVTAVSSGGTTVDTDGVAVTVGVFGKTAMGFKVNDYAQYTNTSLGGTDNSAALPIGVNVLNVGSTDGSSNNLNGTIRKIACYPLRVTNAQLQGLTS